jgi:hypothetical protein
MGIAGFRCGECGGEKFPPGIQIVLCPRCTEKIHAGCWPRHRLRHLEQEPAVPVDDGARRGTMGDYGVIRWADRPSRDRSDG